jgi:hypothetical protein
VADEQRLTSLTFSFEVGNEVIGRVAQVVAKRLETRDPLRGHDAVLGGERKRFSALFARSIASWSALALASATVWKHSFLAYGLPSTMKEFLFGRRS